MKQIKSRFLLYIIIASLLTIILYFVFISPDKEHFNSNNNRYKWLDPYYSLCSNYNYTSPILEGKCPDSSFTYVLNVNSNLPTNTLIKNTGPGCIQLKESPYCYSLPNGTYVPNEIKLIHTSA